MPASKNEPDGKLVHNIAQSMADCLLALQRRGTPVTAPIGATIPWCNATWDTVLCWPATPANTSTSLPCPPLKGLDPEKDVMKVCHETGHWMGKPPHDLDFANQAGWTNYYPCITNGVIDLDTGQTAQAIAKMARRLEFVGLGLSFVSLSLCIFIFTYFRRLRSFRNMLHLQLMTAILMVVIIRLILYIDLIFTDKLGAMQTLPVGQTINTMTVVCESMYLLLEYFKAVAFAWMFLEGWYLHNTLVFTVFNTEPKIRDFMVVGYGVPILHTALWFTAVLLKRGSVERCLGSYYLEPEFWIMDGPRMLELCINFLFICNVIRVLWSKVRDSHDSSEMEKMRKSVKAALMLIPLLGIPNIMQTIPFTPTSKNIIIFAIWTYLASFTYMFQGFMVATLYCFTNKEVINVVKMSWGRYKLQHSTGEGLRRPPKAASVAHFLVSGGRTGPGGRQAPNATTSSTDGASAIRRGPSETPDPIGTHLEPPNYESIVHQHYVHSNDVSPQSGRAIVNYSVHQTNDDMPRGNGYTSLPVTGDSIDELTTTIVNNDYVSPEMTPLKTSEVSTTNSDYLESTNRPSVRFIDSNEITL